MKLIIVESPTKATTISKFLGKEFTVVASYGHTRDLPRGKLGIDVEHDFQPTYVIPTKKRKILNQLKKIAKTSDVVYFASDADREGEAIAWHLQQSIIQAGKENKRIVFHEITKSAITDAIKQPRQINQNLVDAQQARRILDRLVGYKLSPLLWKKIARHLSAGRVQSPTLRLIVEREQEIKKFKPQEYWNIQGAFTKQSSNFEAKLLKIDNKKIDKFALTNEKEAQQIIDQLETATFIVENIKQKETNRSPLPPFTTSTLQQQANQQLGFSGTKTMFVAQKLYEGIKLDKKETQGLITYMRTDSFNLSDKFLQETQQFLKKEYGANYSLSEPRRYKVKTKLAQEAHEAIRPTFPDYLPEKIQADLSPDQFKLYQLIWRRTIASQMPSAKVLNTSVDLQSKQYIFRANGAQIKFDGYLKLYPDKFTISILPSFKLKEVIDLIKLEKIQSFTQPPPRFNDASLVKALEEFGIGRPSTYAPIIKTIQQRGYVVRQQRKFQPTEIGTMVNNLLVEHFPHIVDYQFTAKLENQLDDIAQGKKEWITVIKDFYQPFSANLKKKEQEISKEKIMPEKTDKLCPKCNSPLVIKISRFGKFLACSNFPKCRYTESLKPAEKKYTGVSCPQCEKGQIIEKKTRKNRIFYACDRWPDCKFALWNKPIPSTDQQTSANEKNPPVPGRKCPKCDSLLVEFGKNKKIKCSNKECDYIENPSTKEKK